MATLEFPWQCSSKTTVNYILSRVDDPTAQDHFVVRKPILVREGNSTTFRGVLRRCGKRVANIVCKFAYGKRNLKRLRHEATIYREHLQDLGGKVVPRFYGLYEGEMEDEEPTGCLVTQYCGEHAEVPFYGLSWHVKSYLISALVRVHDAGVLHGDFREANVVFTPNKGSPYIIDFDHAEVHHCESTMPSEIHDVAPHPEDFACDELFDACKSMGVWTPRSYASLASS
ncbi:hypothetical protein B0H21DRAFT_701280 [Amylocystis lapponica]|nr:hypothetical protein B0H21DRAFT_701280 [Amylocystis lapponica]